MRTSGCIIDGKHFVETHAWGASRYTRRVFIDGKMMTRDAWLAEMNTAKKAETSDEFKRKESEQRTR